VAFFVWRIAMKNKLDFGEDWEIIEDLGVTNVDGTPLKTEGEPPVYVAYWYKIRHKETGEEKTKKVNARL
jgi:hypothetical protein